MKTTDRNYARNLARSCEQQRDRREAMRNGAPPSWSPDPAYVSSKPVAEPTSYVARSESGAVFVFIPFRPCERHGASSYSGRCSVCMAEAAP